MKTFTFTENFAFTSGEKRVVFKGETPNGRDIRLTNEGQNELKKIPEYLGKTKEKVDITILANMAETIANDLAKQGIDGFGGKIFNRKQFVIEMKNSNERNKIIQQFLTDGFIKYDEYKYFDNKEQKNNIPQDLQSAVNRVKNQAHRKALEGWLSGGKVGQDRARKWLNEHDLLENTVEKTETISQNRDFSDVSIFSDENILKTMATQYNTNIPNVKEQLKKSTGYRNAYNEIKKQQNESIKTKTKKVENSEENNKIQNTEIKNLKTPKDVLIKFRQIESISPESDIKAMKEKMEELLKNLDKNEAAKITNSSEYKIFISWVKKNLGNEKTANTNSSNLTAKRNTASTTAEKAAAKKAAAKKAAAKKAAAKKAAAEKAVPLTAGFPTRATE